MNTLFEVASNRKDDWYTPPHIVEALGKFDLDPCAPVVRLWDTAATHYTIKDDGLTKQWFGRVWCNPPYSDIDSWLKKCAYHQNVIAMVFARLDTKAFFRNVWGGKALSIFVFSGRINFYTPDGERKGNAGAPSILISYSENNCDAIADSGLRGQHIPLMPQLIVVGISSTWFSVVRMAAKDTNDLRAVYEMVERIAPDKVKKNQHWRAKVRQQIQKLRRKHEEGQQEAGN